jgi:thioesterase domain-containing protein
MFSVSPNSDGGAVDQKMLLAELLLQSRRQVQTETYPASLAQQRLWFLEQLGVRTAAYNIHLGFWLRGPLNIDALRSSLHALINRHASLRTDLKLEGRELLQVISQDVGVSLPMSDVSGSADPYPAIYSLAKEEVESTFDLAKGPLFRSRLIRATPTDHVLLCTMHHIISDSWSTQIIARELSALYTSYSGGHPFPLSELPISYGDYSEWQRKWFQTPKVQEQLVFWKNELEDAPPLLTLGMQRPRSSEQTFRGASQIVQLDAEVIAGIKALSVRLQATPFMLLLAAFKILLLRASGQADLSVGVPVAGRNRVEIEGLVGFFVNTLVLRDDLSGNPKFSELVAQVRETTLNAFGNSDVPFEKVVEVLQPERNLSYNPIFQVMFAVIKAAVQSHSFGDLEAFPYIVEPNTSIFDLSMTIIEGVDGIWWAQIEHNTDLFASKDITRLLSDYTTLLQASVSDPQKRISDFPATTLAAEGHQPHNFASERDPLLTQVSGHPHKEIASPVGSVCRSVERFSGWKNRKRKLPARSHSSQPEAAIDILSGEERLLLTIWKDLIRISEIGLDDNFFDIGGHSLLAAQVIAQIQLATNRKIAVSAVFRAPTIRQFAQLLREDALHQPDPIAMKLKSGSSAISFFGVALPGVDTFGFGQLARHLSPDQRVYKLQGSAPVVSGRPLSETELQDLARQYVKAMKAEQPHGPYCLGAMCEGVLVAQQMILLLESQKEEVGLFAIFDTWVLENSQIRPLWAMDYYMQRWRNFMSSSLSEQFDTLRRIVSRKKSPKKDPGRGWNLVYWPGKDFTPPRFNAPVLLFKRPRQPFFYVRDPNMGWAERSIGGVTTFELECGHAEMLREPFVRTVGLTLQESLQNLAKQRETDSKRQRRLTA